jgi:hypothetical protein
MKNKLLEDINVSIVNNTSGESLSLLYSSIHDNLHDIQKKVTTFRNRIILFGLVYILLINGLISFKEILLFPNISISMIQGKLYGFQNMKDLIILMTPLFVTIQYLLLNIMLVGRSILRGGQRILCVKAIPTLEDTVALSVILPMSAGQVLKILTHLGREFLKK